MFSVQFTKQAEQQFSKLDQQTQQRIVSVLERVRIRPDVHLVKLVGAPSFKCRIGDYRAICILDYKQNCMFVIKIGHRKNVYA